jgi:aerobic C4-dicarboxylate transport protein
MSEARALTNLIGNGVATVVVGKWTGDLDSARLTARLNNETVVDAQDPEQAIDATVYQMPIRAQA